MNNNGYLMDPTKHDVIDKENLLYHAQSEKNPTLAHCNPKINLDLDTKTAADDISKYATCGRCKKQLSVS